MNETQKIISEYYNSQVETEWERIADKPEFLLTCRMLDRYIKQGDKILDIGGGPGRYSLYLANKGCDVTLLDLSPENVKFAKKEAELQNLTVECVVGDALDAGAYVSGLYDHVLLMGPMYHLLEESERIKAVSFALELLKPGGMLFVAFISMSGGLVFLLREVPEQVLEDEHFLVPLAEGKSYAGAAFTQAFFINQNEVLPFMAQFPLEKLHLFGQESILAPHVHNVMSQPADVFEAWLNFAEEMCEKEEYLSWSEHLMYVGRKVGEDDSIHNAQYDEDEQIVKEDIAYFNSLPVVFEGFIDLPELSDGEIHLVCFDKRTGDTERNWLPSYEFLICKGSEKVGNINLRIGYGGGQYNSNCYYSGQIGYGIDEKYRGNGYAGRACKLLEPVAKAHGMTKLLITTDVNNAASIRVCEKLGIPLRRTVRLPEWHDSYKGGSRFHNIFEWSVECD